MSPLIYSSFFFLFILSCPIPLLRKDILSRTDIILPFIPTTAPGYSYIPLPFQSAFVHSLSKIPKLFLFSANFSQPHCLGCQPPSLVAHHKPLYYAQRPFWLHLQTLILPTFNCLCLGLKPIISLPLLFTLQYSQINNQKPNRTLHLVQDFYSINCCLLYPWASNPLAILSIIPDNTTHF